MLVTTSSKFLTLLIFFFLSTSCETFNELAGLAKPQLDDSLALETPDLVLPPDFGKEPRASMVESKQNIQQKKNAPQISQPMMSYQTINPRITNYLSPRINVQSSPTPSDSLEKFKINKKFTIGEWVYSQYVDGFKRGNIYYRPVYDKGYNFSRRYVPDRNVASFQPSLPLPNVESYFPPDNEFFQPSSTPMEYDSLDQLPVLD